MLRLLIILRSMWPKTMATAIMAIKLSELPEPIAVTHHVWRLDLPNLT